MSGPFFHEFQRPRFFFFSLFYVEMKQKIVSGAVFNPFEGQTLKYPQYYIFLIFLRRTKRQQQTVGTKGSHRKQGLTSLALPSPTYRTSQGVVSAGLLLRVGELVGLFVCCSTHSSAGQATHAAATSCPIMSCLHLSQIQTPPDYMLASYRPF